MSPASSAVARRTLRDTRVRDGAFAAFFALQALIQPLGFRHSFPTLADRVAFARSFGDNAAVRLFYGSPHELLTAGGYTAWRVGGFLAILAGAWGALAAVRALRAEEDSGRIELALAGIVDRRGAFTAALAAVAAGVALLWAALAIGLVAGGLPLDGSLYLALATMTPALVFAGVGALASQLAGSRRVASELAIGALAAGLLLRVVADTSAGLSWLRWTTPLGWAEELRPFADTRPLVLLLPLAATTLLLSAAAALAVRRDVGRGVLEPRDRRRPRLALLRSPTALALREERAGALAWLGGVALFAVVVGILSDSFRPDTIGPDLQRQLSQVGGASLVTPGGALSFYFLFFAVAFALYACAQIAAARREEAEQRLETLLAAPVARRRWLGGRLLLAAGGLVALALTSALASWAGAASQDAGVPLTDLLAGAANTLPLALLFLALGALAFAVMPRAASGAAYGLVAVAFVWELFGSLLGAPAWLLGLSPFHQLALVPAQPFKATAAVIMLALAASAAGLALVAFDRRDLASF